jgi:methylated-DNA-[protein]-cysteine S-methyltransferase
MPLQITWQSVESSEQTRVYVPVFGVELVLTVMGDVITDASWAIHDRDSDVPDSVLVEQVQRYLANPNANHLHLKLKKQGSAYSNRVWNALMGIPVGQVVSYSALAEKLNSAPRAIAKACRTNPYAGIIPCHRVVAKTGIGGFMGSSSGEFIELKRRLLVYERSIGQSEQ